MLNPFMHSEMQFRQQKIAILSRFTSPDSGQKGQNIERLDNAYVYVYSVHHMHMSMLRDRKARGLFPYPSGFKSHRV